MAVFVVLLMVGTSAAWTFQYQRIISPTPLDDAFFGGSIDVAGSVMAVGAPASQATGSAGAVHIFERVPGTDTWLLESTISAPPGADGFGSSVDLFGSNDLLVGAPDEDVAGFADAGAVYEFKRGTNNDWSLDDYIVSPDPGTNYGFGSSVAHHVDAVFIGEPTSAVGGTWNGRVHSFWKSTSGANHLETFVDPLSSSWNVFGAALEIDESTFSVVVGASMSMGNGRAYLLERQSSYNWDLTETFAPPPYASGQGVTSGFGFSVSIDNGLVAVGAPRSYLNNIGDDNGIVYVYADQGSSWAYEARIVPAEDHWPGFQFGWSVSIEDDLLAIGATHGDSIGTPYGEAYLFKRSTANTWFERQAYLGVGGVFNGGHMGHSIALEGGTIAAGAPYENAAGQFHSGAVYMFAVACLDLNADINALGQVISYPLPCLGLVDDIGDPSTL